MAFPRNLSNGVVLVSWWWPGSAPVQVEPLAFSRCVRSTAGRFQAQLLLQLFPVSHHPGEEPASFAQGRRHQGASLARSCGKWSAAWASSVFTWNDHILRANDAQSWGHTLANWNGEDWLQERRLATGGGVFASRTGTRMWQGRPAMRWHEGLGPAAAR